MKYVTTNIRLPEELWRALKLEAAEQGKRLSEIIRERVAFSSFKKKIRTSHKTSSLCGIWKGVKIPDALIEEAKQSVFHRRPPLGSS